MGERGLQANHRVDGIGAVSLGQDLVPCLTSKLPDWKFISSVVAYALLSMYGRLPIPDQLLWLGPGITDVRLADVSNRSFSRPTPPTVTNGY